MINRNGRFDSGSLAEGWCDGMRFESVMGLRKTKGTDGTSVKASAESGAGAAQ